MAQLRITARMYIGTPSGCLGLRGAAARLVTTWPLALVGLGARHIRAIRYGQLRQDNTDYFNDLLFFILRTSEALGT
jgi:hypothetical protein